jgi:AcrR family transcriptional regulator
MSTKVNPLRKRRALLPQRSNGRERVSEILEAAARVIQERGFDAATMSEIAEHAQANTGSLYRFFPSKEALAEALMQRYALLMEERYDQIEAMASDAKINQLADALVDFIANIHEETTALIALLDSRSEWSTKRSEFRAFSLDRIVAILRRRAPKLNPKLAQDMAVVLLHSQKTMAAITLDPKAATSPGAANQLRGMNRLYLRARLEEAG